MSEKAILITWDNENCKPDDLINLIKDIKKSHHTIISEYIDNPKIGHVKECRETMFYGVDCLENEEEFGFFKSLSDKRPSSCSWIKKQDALNLAQLLEEQEIIRRNKEE